MLKNICYRQGSVTVTAYWTLSIYCRAICLETKFKSEMSEVAFSNEYLDGRNFQEEDYKRGVTFRQIRNAWLSFIRTMFNACYPNAIERNLLPDVVKAIKNGEKDKSDKSESKMFQAVSYEAATVHFAKLISDRVYFDIVSLTNPLHSGQNLQIPIGCDKMSLPARIKFPSAYGEFS